MPFINIGRQCLKGKNWSYESNNTDDWNLPWLKSKFTDNQWLIDNGKPTLKTIKFDDWIPSTNGHLSDKKFILFVNAIKKILILGRTGHLSNSEKLLSLTTRADSMNSRAVSLKTLALFLINEYGENLASKNGFTLLTSFDLKKFYTKIAEGRADLATGLTDKIIERLATLNADDLLAIIQNNGNKKSGALISKLLKHLSIKKNKISLITSIYIKEYIAELFPELSSLQLSKEKNRRTEYPNLCPPYIDTTKNMGQTTFESFTYAAIGLRDYSLYIPELKGYSNPTVSLPDKFFNKYLKIKSRTPNIPTNTALYYLNNAISFVIKYGDNIIFTKKHCETELLNLHKRNPKLKRDYFLSPACPRHITIPINNFTEDFKVTRFNLLPSKCTIVEKRNNVTVLFAYRMLCAAIYILIHTFCVKRYSEILQLKESNLVHGLWGGYELDFGLRKAEPTDNSLLTSGRPIPNIVFKGVSQLLDANKHFFYDEIDPYLFPSKFTSNIYGKSPTNNYMDRNSLINILAEFGDFIQVPTTIVNGIDSRFYLTRTHVLRRFGAKAFKTLSNLDDFPALSWLMGHSNTDETWHYIQEEIANDELTEEESIAVVDAITNPDIDTTQIETMTNSNTNFEFNNLSRESAINYIQEILEQGSTVHKYTDDDGKIIIWIEKKDPTNEREKI